MIGLGSMASVDPARSPGFGFALIGIYWQCSTSVCNSRIEVYFVSTRGGTSANWFWA